MRTRVPFQSASPVFALVTASLIVLGGAARAAALMADLL